MRRTAGVYRKIDLQLDNGSEDQAIFGYGPEDPGYILYVDGSDGDLLHWIMVDTACPTSNIRNKRRYASTLSPWTVHIALHKVFFSSARDGLEHPCCNNKLDLLLGIWLRLETAFQGEVL